MNFICGFLLVLASSFIELEVTAAEGDGHFVNAWAAEIVGGEDVARDVAQQYGYRLVRSLGSIPDHYLLERSDTPIRSRRSADHHTRKLSEDDRVIFVEQQQQKTRVKRDAVARDPVMEIVQRDGVLDDPDFQNEWYLIQGDTRSSNRDISRADLRVREVWKMGYTGKGVVVTIIDDGLEIKHDDLKRNYASEASFDLNDHDDDPSPRYDPTNENKHGTRCAGEVAMVANNGKCGVGVAFDAKIGGIRALDGVVTDHLEGSALSYNNNFIDIYSCSWGPNDDGKTCEGPGPVTMKALKQGVRMGRKGLGSIYVWAAGNGGRKRDSCNADGYTSAIETITVSSASQEGHIPYYSERCASTLTTAYSSGSSSEGKVVSADLHNKCTDSHSGTSAAAPLASGILALLLEANPNVTWRDVQHIIVHTSRWEPLSLQKGWYRNAAGYCVNLAFGFGLIDALGIVNLGNSKTFKSVGPQRICRVEPVNTSGFPQEFLSGQSVEVEFITDGCAGQENEINFLEHIQIVVNIAHEKRGNIYAECESPSGTITTLMMERSNDNSKAGFKNWAFTNTHTWGERPRGIWKFRVADRSSDNLRGSLKSATLVLYGTKEQPEHQKNIISKCPELGNSADTLENIIDIDRESDLDRKMQSLAKMFSYSSTPEGGNKLESLQSKVSAQNKPTTVNNYSDAIKEIIKSLSHG